MHSLIKSPCCCWLRHNLINYYLKYGCGKWSNLVKQENSCYLLLCFEVTGFSPYLCVPSPFSSYDNNSINSGLRFICKPWSLFCFPTVSSCSPLYSPFYHLILQPSIIVSPSFLCHRFSESWYPFSFQLLSSVILRSWKPSKLFAITLEKLLLLSSFLVMYFSSGICLCGFSKQHYEIN